MSNPNNLLRPPILNPPPNPPPNPPLNPQFNPQNADLQAYVTNIVTRVLNAEGRNIIQGILNPNSDQIRGIDQIINPEHRANLADLDKVPDVVRCLRDFSGQPGEYSSWRKSVDRILRLYEPVKGTPKYFGILSVIRNKIVGNADIALESYNTP